jgi:hypothetical protein
LVSKSIEILELSKTKSSELLKHLNDTAKVILCIDISCELLNIPFADTKAAIQLSSLRKIDYNKNRKIILKVLNLNKVITIDEIIRKLNVANPDLIQRTAKEIFKYYQKNQPYEEDIKEVHQSIFTMCVNYACKIEKVKLTKKNVLNISALTHTQFNQLEKSWLKWIPDVEKKLTKKENKKQLIVNDNQNDMDANETKARDDNARNCNSECETRETFEQWRQRMLDKAFAELAAMKK